MIETFATRSPHTVAGIVAAIAAALASGEYRFGALVIDSRTSSRFPPACSLWPRTPRFLFRSG